MQNLLNWLENLSFYFFIVQAAMPTAPTNKKAAATTMPLVPRPLIELSEIEKESDIQ